MKILLILLTVVFFKNTLFAQSDTNTGINLYKDLTNEIGVDKSISLYHRTSLKTLKKVHFKDGYLKWFGKIKVDGLDNFFKSIDLENVKETKIVSKIGSHPFLYTIDQHVYIQSYLVFSPIIYSHDRHLALCSVMHWEGPDAASETIYVIELKSKKWTVVRFLLVSIS